jgi:cytochrome c oxidase assembly protein subunit 15
MVDWKLLGRKLPSSDDEWNEEFDKYKQIPQYKLVNPDMTLEGFKGIFWWEWAHRLLGRLIGLSVLLPLLWFAWRGVLRGALLWRLFGIALLIGAQGAMGWYMVQSGLVDDPRVSQFRLTAHLSLAFVILGSLLWSALDLLPDDQHSLGQGMSTGTRHLLRSVLAVVAWMIVTGGFVAGIRAGLAYNSFPLMNGQWIPDEILLLEPWWKNFFWNMATVQFDHRIGAWLLALMVPWLSWRVLHESVTARAKLAVSLLLGMLLIQVILGISTLLLRVPVALGAAHQGGAALLFMATLFTWHSLRRSGSRA